MRITSRIATAGEAGLSRFPVAKCTMDEMCNKKGSIDEAKARKALDGEGITWAKDDDILVIAVAAEFLSQQRSVIEGMAKDSKEMNASLKSERDPFSPKDPCERRMAKGRFAFVRVDITRQTSKNACRVKLGYANPRNVVGETENFAHDFAVMQARILVYIATEMANVGTKIILEEGDNAKGIFREAEWRNRKEQVVKSLETMNEKRETCPNRKVNLCSPIKPKCGCYHCGRCEKAILGAEWEEYNG